MFWVSFQSGRYCKRYIDPLRTTLFTPSTHYRTTQIHASIIDAPMLQAGLGLLLRSHERLFNVYVLVLCNGLEGMRRAFASCHKQHDRGYTREG